MSPLMCPQCKTVLPSHAIRVHLFRSAQDPLQCPQCQFVVSDHPEVRSALG